MKKIFKSEGSKATIAYVLASIFTKSLGIITLPFYTNYLSESEIGLCSIYNTWSSVLLIISSLGLTTAAFNAGYSVLKEDKYSYSYSLVILSFVSNTILFLIYFIFSGFWSNLLAIPMPLMILMFISFYASPSLDFYLFMQRYEYKYKSSVFITLIQAVLIVGFGIGSVLFFKTFYNSSVNLGNVRLFATVSISIILGFIFILYFGIKSRFKVNVKYWKYILPVSIPLIVHNISKIILDSSDKVMIQQMIGMNEVGIYSTVYSISTLFLIVWNAVNASLIPYMFEELKNKETCKKRINKVVFPVLIGFSVVAVLFSIVAPEMLLILTKDTYAQASFLVPPIVAGVYLTAVYNIYTNVLVFEKKTYLIMIGTVLAAIANIILNYLFIDIFGYVAASYTTLACFVILSIIQYLLSRNAFKADVVNSFGVLVLSILTIVICVLTSLIYSYWIIRYSIFILTVVSAIIFRKKIINFYAKNVLRRKTE